MRRRTIWLPALCLAALLCFVFASCDSSPATVCISEVMSQNSSVFVDENGKTSDWIELYNPTDSAVDLNNWSITDDPLQPKKYVFPPVTLESGAYLLLYADKSTEGGEEALHLPFSLSKDGERLQLFDSETHLVSLLDVPRLSENQSFGRNEAGVPAVLEFPTPGWANDALVVEDPASALPAVKVRINEYSTNKTQTLLSKDGDFVSWVELYNPSKTAVSLEGFSLSDNEGKPQKWVFPPCTIEGKGYLVVLLSGETKDYDGAGELHASFELNGKEAGLWLFDASARVLDSCKVYPLFSNLSCGRIKENWRFFAAATPGYANKTDAFDSVDDASLTDSKALVISEVAAVNTSETAPNGKTADYIELYNPSSSPAMLRDYKLSDSKNAERFFSLPDLVLQPHSYVTVWCGKKANGSLFVPFSLKRYGETVYLMNRRGVIVDALEYRRLSAGVACGRVTGQSDEPVYFSVLSPGKENPAPLRGALQNPVFSVPGGYVKQGTRITLQSEHVIYYTLDGSEPTKKSQKYTKPIRIGKTTCVRARAYQKGSLPSDIVTATYLVEQKHDLPVICLATDSRNLYSEKSGIWADGKHKSSEFPYLGANYWQNWERPVHVEYLNEKGLPQLSFDCGIKVFGQFSRALEQKSVSLLLRDRYGPEEICYPLFPDNDVNVFSSLVLRNSGQDFTSAHLRDAFCAMVMKGQTSVDFMDYRPVAVYVNGVYHGLYDLREKIDDDYLKHHHGAADGGYDLIKGVKNVQSGSMDNYNALISYIKTHDTSKPEVYQALCGMIDIDELIEYWMFESFFTNTDTGNIRFYRSRAAGGTWKWIFFDADWSFTESTYRLNYIDNYLDPQGHGVNHAFSTLIMRSLMKNSAFRTRLLELHKKHLSTTFDTKRMLSILDSMTQEIDSEMRRHCARWSSVSYAGWQRNVKTLRNIVSQMHDLFEEKMIRSFSMTAEEQARYLK